MFIEQAPNIFTQLNKKKKKKNPFQCSSCNSLKLMSSSWSYLIRKSRSKEQTKITIKYFANNNNKFQQLFSSLSPSFQLIFCVVALGQVAQACQLGLWWWSSCKPSCLMIKEYLVHFLLPPNSLKRICYSKNYSMSEHSEKYLKNQGKE